VIEFENMTNLDLDVTVLENIANSLAKKDIEFVLCNDTYMQNINREFRAQDKTTDVLSFPLEDMPNAPLGTIVVSLDTASKAATRYNHAVEDEIALLFIHGLLHLLGYDHEVDEGQMRQKEVLLIEAFDLPQSLIVRMEE
jgi:probable rRNA maturation factor